MRNRVVAAFLVTAAIMISCCASVRAQDVEPFANLSLGIDSDCPFACDSFELVFAGEYTSSNWQTPFVQRIEPSASGTTLIVYMSVNFDSGVGLPVITPFETRIPYGPLPTGRYQIVYSIGFFGEPTPIPNRNIRDTIVIGAPGDVNCDQSTDVGDVVNAINQIFRGAMAADPFARGDLTCDSHRDVLDVLQAIDYTFRAGTVCGPCELTTPPLIMTDISPDSLAVDTFATSSVTIDGDSLRIRFGYGGGCLTHHFAVYMSPSTFEGPTPRIAHIYPVHHDHWDGCEAYILDWVSVGLQGMKKSYLEQYPGDPGPVILRVHDYNSPVFEDLIYSIE